LCPAAGTWSLAVPSSSSARFSTSVFLASAWETMRHLDVLRAPVGLPWCVELAEEAQNYVDAMRSATVDGDFDLE
jgi:hypothetical protein